NVVGVRASRLVEGGAPEHAKTRPGGLVLGECGRADCERQNEAGNHDALRPHTSPPWREDPAACRTPLLTVLSRMNRARKREEAGPEVQIRQPRARKTNDPARRRGRSNPGSVPWVYGTWPGEGEPRRLERKDSPVPFLVIPDQRSRSQPSRSRAS